MEWSNLLSTLMGGLIGFGGAWLNQFLAERVARREAAEQRMQQLISYLVRFIVLTDSAEHMKPGCEAWECHVRLVITLDQKIPQQEAIYDSVNAMIGMAPKVVTGDLSSATKFFQERAHLLALAQEFAQQTASRSK